MDRAGDCAVTGERVRGADVDQQALPAWRPHAPRREVGAIRPTARASANSSAMVRRAMSSSYRSAVSREHFDAIAPRYDALRSQLFEDALALLVRAGDLAGRRI